MACYLSQGNKSPKVGMIQYYLQVHGFYRGYKIDCKFGEVTTREVKAFQQNRGLVVDGCVGCQTWRVLVYPPCPWEAEPVTPTPTPTPIPPGGNIKGYWMNYDDAKKATVEELTTIGITDIFVLVSRFEDKNNYYKKVLPELIKKFRGVRVHSWSVIFKNKDGSWHTPKDIAFGDEIVNKLADFSKIEGLAGIHLDYVRYPGSAKGDSESITQFVSKVREVTKGKILSAAVMPEMDSNAPLYGQDYAQMGKYCDWLLPMAYKNSYKANTPWIGRVVKYINERAPGKVICGIMSYVSDSDTTKLKPDELNTDIKTAIDNGAKGFCLFKYGLSRYGEGIVQPKPTQPTNVCVLKEPFWDDQDQHGTASCGPTSLAMLLSTFNIKIDHANVIPYTHTTPTNTNPVDIIQGAIQIGKEHGINFKGWREDFNERWDYLGKLMADPNTAVILHGHTSGWRKFYTGNYGHYVFPVSLNLCTKHILIADPARSWTLDYTFGEFLPGLKAISQPSMIIIQRQ
jgi:hypothetical protein